MFVLNVILYAFAIFGALCLFYLVTTGMGSDKPDRDDYPRVLRKPSLPKEARERRPVLIPSEHTLSLLERLYEIEYGELAVGTHDAFRDDPNARIPVAVREELDSMDGRASILVLRTINYIRTKRGIEPVEIMPDFDNMLRRVIQRYEDEFNYPPTNFRH